MQPAEIFQELKALAPGVAFSVETEPDPNYVWDGSKETDPADDGMMAVTVDIVATTIIDGAMVEGFAHLMGHYVGDEDDSDLGGYLPQKLHEAAVDLRVTIGEKHLVADQLFRVISFLKRELKERYDEQRSKIDTLPS